MPVLHVSGIKFIDLDDGELYRKALYLMVKTHGFPVDFPLNQPNDKCVPHFFPAGRCWTVMD